MNERFSISVINDNNNVICQVKDKETNKIIKCTFQELNEIIYSLLNVCKNI